MQPFWCKYNDMYTTREQVERALCLLSDGEKNVKWIFTGDEVLKIFSDVLVAHNLREKYEPEGSNARQETGRQEEAQD
jgi:hypothetical protein